MEKRHYVGDLISFYKDGESSSSTTQKGVIRYVTYQKERIGTANAIKVLLEEGAIVEADCGEYWWVPFRCVLEDKKVVS